MSADDLHAVLTVRIDELERDALPLQASAPFVEETDRCTCYGGSLPQGHEPGCGFEPGPYWWMIIAYLRGLAEDRDILARHYRVEYQDWPPQYGPPPAICDHCTDYWPCADVASLARRHEVKYD